MRQINIHQAKTHLSRLLEELGEGEEIIIAKAGKPVARLVGLGTIPRKRTRRIRKPNPGYALGWSKEVLEFAGIPELEPFESHRSELKPPKSDPLEP